MNKLYLNTTEQIQVKNFQSTMEVKSKLSELEEDRIKASFNEERKTVISQISYQRKAIILLFLGYVVILIHLSIRKIRRRTLVRF